MAGDATTVAPDSYKALLDNDRVRLLEYRGAPGTKTEMHSHPDVLAYALTGGKFKFTMPGGQSFEADLKDGDSLYMEAADHANGKRRRYRGSHTPGRAEVASVTQDRKREGRSNERPSLFGTVPDLPTGSHGQALVEEQEALRQSVDVVQHLVPDALGHRLQVVVAVLVDRQAEGVDLLRLGLV